MKLKHGIKERTFAEVNTHLCIRSKYIPITLYIYIYWKECKILCFISSILFMSNNDKLSPQIDLPAYKRVAHAKSIANYLHTYHMYSIYTYVNTLFIHTSNTQRLFNCMLLSLICSLYKYNFFKVSSPSIRLSRFSRFQFLMHALDKSATCSLLVEI